MHTHTSTHTHLNSTAHALLQCIPTVRRGPSCHKPSHHPLFNLSVPHGPWSQSRPQSSQRHSRHTSQRGRRTSTTSGSSGREGEGRGGERRGEGSGMRNLHNNVHGVCAEKQKKSEKNDRVRISQCMHMGYSACTVCACMLHRCLYERVNVQCHYPPRHRGESRL